METQNQYSTTSTTTTNQQQQYQLDRQKIRILIDDIKNFINLYQQQISKGNTSNNDGNNEDRTTEVIIETDNRFMNHFEIKFFIYKTCELLNQLKLFINTVVLEPEEFKQLQEDKKFLDKIILQLSCDSYSFFNNCRMKKKYNKIPNVSGDDVGNIYFGHGRGGHHGHFGHNNYGHDPRTFDFFTLMNGWNHHDHHRYHFEYPTGGRDHPHPHFRGMFC